MQVATVSNCNYIVNVNLKLGLAVASFQPELIHCEVVTIKCSVLQI